MRLGDAIISRYANMRNYVRTENFKLQEGEYPTFNLILNDMAKESKN